MPTPQEEHEDYIRRLIASEEETRVDQPVPPHPTNAQRPQQAQPQHPIYDSLPHRVDEIDMDATRVTPAAYQPAPQPQPRPASVPPRARQGSDWQTQLSRQWDSFI